MSITYDDNIGVIDLTGQLVVHVDEDGIVERAEGVDFPLNSQGEPYRFGVKCLDQNGKQVLVTTDMDYQSLVAE